MSDKRVLLALAAVGIIAEMQRTTFRIDTRPTEVTLPPDDDSRLRRQRYTATDTTPRNTRQHFAEVCPPKDDAGKERVAKAQAKRERRRARNRANAQEVSNA